MYNHGKEHPEVSIVIATRNRRAMLADAVNSVQAQAGVDWELIVVDDASTDGTWDFLSGLHDPRIRCFRQEKQYERSAARNLGLTNSRSEFIIFLDDDDLLWPKTLSVLKDALEKYPDSVAAIGARWDWFVDGHYGRRDVHPRFMRRRHIFDELLFGWSAVSGQNLYRTEVVRDVGGYDISLNICEDRDLWLRVAGKGLVLLCPEIVMTYRVHRGQWRPDNLLQIRERVARRAIRNLPRPERRRALIFRWCTALVQQAEDAIRAGRYAAGIGLTVRAFAAAPRLFTSPLIGPWVARRLAGRIWHQLKGS
jgi:glycosyltransferase involved in cell wall biosynthesis